MRAGFTVWTLLKFHSANTFIRCSTWLSARSSIVSRHHYLWTQTVDAVWSLPSHTTMNNVLLVILPDSVVLPVLFAAYTHTRTHRHARTRFLYFHFQSSFEDRHSQQVPTSQISGLISFFYDSFSLFWGWELFVLVSLLFAFHPKYATIRVFSRPAWLAAPQEASDSGGICQGNCPSIINEWLIGFLAGFSWQLSITLARISAAFSVWSQFI